MTIGQVASILGIHPQKLRRLERSGDVPAARRGKLSGIRYYDNGDLECLAFGVTVDRVKRDTARPGGGDVTPATAERPAFSTGEVARLLGIATETLRRAEREGRIPVARRETVGDDRLAYRVYTAEDIDELRRYFSGR